VRRGLEVRETPALSEATLTQTRRTSSLLLSVRAYVLARPHAMRRVTVSCDASRCSPDSYCLIENSRFSVPWRALRDGVRERQPLLMRATAFRIMCKSHIL